MNCETAKRGIVGSEYVCGSHSIANTDWQFV